MKKLLLLVVILLSMTAVSMAQPHHPVRHRRVVHHRHHVVHHRHVVHHPTPPRPHH